jgi:acetyl esterase/lipase
MPAMATEVKREAELSLRERGGLIDVRVHWPAAPEAERPPVLVFLSDLDSGPEEVSELCRELCAELGIVVLSVRTQALDAATTALEWTADHGAQLGADPGRLLVGGIGAGASLAAAVAQGARDNGWPEVTEVTDLASSLRGAMSFDRDRGPINHDHEEPDNHDC